MVHASKRRATYEDVLNAPEHLNAEIVDGELHLQPRPRGRHGRAATGLAHFIGGPFDFDAGGPGGWVFIHEPELHLGEEILIPDLGGWRKERYPREEEDEAFYSVAPDWVCEVLSPSTAAFDRVKKLPIYRREGVGHVWLVDPVERTIEIFRLDGESYRLVSTHGGDSPLRGEPFEAAEIPLARIWSRDEGE